MNFDAVTQTANEVLSAIQEMPSEPYPAGAKSTFPAVWCEWASIAIAQVLKDRGRGGWSFVTAGRPEDASGHAWLEVHDDNGLLQFTIDATLNQFTEWNEPCIDVGVTPAALVFTQPRYAGHWTAWPVLDHNDSCRTYADQVSRYVSEASTTPKER